MNPPPAVRFHSHRVSGADIWVYFFLHDDVIKWKLFPRCWPFVWGIHRSPVNSPQKGQWSRAFMFYLICAWTNSWINNRDADDLRRHHAHYGVTVMCWLADCWHGFRQQMSWIESTAIEGCLRCSIIFTNCPTTVPSGGQWINWKLRDWRGIWCAREYGVDVPAQTCGKPSHPQYGDRMQ